VGEGFRKIVFTGSSSLTAPFLPGLSFSNGSSSLGHVLSRARVDTQTRKEPDRATVGESKGGGGFNLGLLPPLLLPPLRLRVRNPFYLLTADPFDGTNRTEREDEERVTLEAISRMNGTTGFVP
jgi:hypothetical protein